MTQLRDRAGKRSVFTHLAHTHKRLSGFFPPELPSATERENCRWFCWRDFNLAWKPFESSNEWTAALLEAAPGNIPHGWTGSVDRARVANDRLVFHASPCMVPRRGEVSQSNRLRVQALPTAIIMLCCTIELLAASVCGLAHCLCLFVCLRRWRHAQSGDYFVVFYTVFIYLHCTYTL